MFDQQRYVNLSLPVAIGELVDNSITSFERLPAASAPCRVDIRLGQHSENSIEIRDNGLGIRESDLNRLFRMGNPSPDDVGLSRHGMGLKVAGFWWGRRIEIESSALGEPVSRTIVVDLTTEETRRPLCRESPGEPDHHFTRILISNAYEERTLPQTTQKAELLTALGSIYEDYLAAGYEIYLDDRPLEYEATVCLEAPFWPSEKGPNNESPRLWQRDLSFNVGSRTVSGWIGQREQGSTALAGLVLTWNRKAIRGSAATPTYRPRQLYPGGNSYVDQRLVGRFDIGEFEKSLTTDGVSWSLDDESEFVDHILAAIDTPEFPLLSMIENYRPRLAKRREKEDQGPFPHDGAVEDLKKARDRIRELEPLPTPTADEFDSDTQQPACDDMPESEVLLDDKIRTLDGPEVRVRLILEHLGTDSRWNTARKHDDSWYDIVINVDHVFHRRYGYPPRHDEAPLMRLALAIGLARVFHGLDSNQIEQFLKIT